MISHLHIKNMALIDDISMDFAPGFNCLTGETGAGKSMLLGAVAAVLGERSGKEMLREGKESGLVELVFTPDEDLLALLKADEDYEDIMADTDELIFSRTFLPTRSSCRINDHTVTVAKLKQTASMLLDLHSQREHQSLLRKETHRQILDLYGGEALEEKKQAVREAYDAYHKAKQDLDALSMDEGERMRRQDLLGFQIKELEEASLRPGEEAELDETYRRMYGAKDLLETLAEVSGLTTAEGQGAGSLVGEAYGKIDSLGGKVEAGDSLISQIATIDELLGDFNRELKAYTKDLTFRPEEYDTVEKRLHLIREMEAKYGKTEEDCLEYLAKAQEEYEALLHADEERERLSSLVAEALDAYSKRADALSEARKQTAKSLCEDITKSLVDLNFLDVRFEVRFEEREAPHPEGKEAGEFYIATNVGESCKPLIQVASGGELSRIMLALKACLAKEDRIPTLIFDEIDAGISGRTAQKVAEKMDMIAKNHQVICVSHLPQIAAMADAHFAITKEAVEDHTETKIRRLSEEEIEEELARLLGGVEITEATLENAREMRAMARKLKSQK